jgi:serine/threonine-protein kinase
MAVVLSHQTSLRPVSIDESFGGESFDGPLRDAGASSSIPEQDNSLKLTSQQIVPVAAIIGVGLLVTGIFLAAVQVSLLDSQTTLMFLQYHSSTIFVAFGFAIFGCAINRQLGKDVPKGDHLGPYKLIKLIGQGGMGEVYLAEHELLKRRCAVKVIRSDKASNRKMLARFEREVKATAQLTHWNTVQVYDYGRTSNGTFYYSMEYLQGLNLRQLVEDHGPLPPGRVIFILRQLCGALHEAATFGLVHRDIKPSNIFLTERGQMFDVAKLLDFGLVRPASFGTCPIRNVSKQLQGSPRFMCPEQAQGQKPDCRGDLYSLACVAYYLLAGRTPFEDENPVFLVVAHTTTPAPTFEEIGVEVPADLADIIMTCLRKKPEERIQSPRELLEAIDRCQCAWDWSWSKAENWWFDHPEETHHQPGEPEGASTKSAPTDSAVGSDPDVTFVCGGEQRDDSQT